jgi:hypothetical protein
MKEAETIFEALVSVKTGPQDSVQNIGTINVATYSVIYFTSGLACLLTYLPTRGAELFFRGHKLCSH